MKPLKDSSIIVAFNGEAIHRSSRQVLRELGINGNPDPRCRWHGQRLICVRLDRPVSRGLLETLEGMAGVRRLMVVARGQGLARRGENQPDSIVEIPGGARVGGKNLAIIAGPCSVESAQISEIAAALREAGATALRAGAFKPRTSPYTFGGLGGRGLEMLALARKSSGLSVVTEATDAEHLDLVARYADVVQLGSRNMQNFPLLFKAGSHPSGKPVLLKRGFGATLDELLQAAEYVLLGRFSAGHERPGLILCERGIRTFEPSTRFTLDISAIPVLREKTHLPVMADPSHATGARRYVLPLARAAVAAGAAGVLVEVHPRPAQAWSDADQCLDLESFRKLTGDLGRLISSDGAP